jgi:glycosyltransferase involved in cell wall biosynthesis
LKIGVMLRSIDEQQGIGVYSRNLMDEMLARDRTNDYVLFYRTPACLGRYARYANVSEKVVTAPNKFLWDQVKIPVEARREKLDALFHTKFTVPFLARCKTAMTIHGASWFVHPELYPKLDIAYIRAVMPLYCRKAAAILSNSDLTTRDFVRRVGVPAAKIHTVPLGTSRDFAPIDDTARIAKARERYRLPPKYILSVVKYDPRKNFENLIAAFRLLRSRIDCKLVVVGIGCEKYAAEYDLSRDGTLDDTVFLGWVDHADLPVLYSEARCLFFPSVYEEFGIPSCEAMACGCPPVVSNTGALPDNVGEAGLTVDPFDPGDMAGALEKVWTDDALREDLARKCLDRARLFTWERCAEQTLQVLNSLDKSRSAHGDAP